MNASVKTSYEIVPIGYIHSCYREKFGIPRQAGMVDKARAYLELIEPFNREEMVRELHQFSHVWIQFLFHATMCDGWRTTVRPPGLGGRQRVGVFASRSPHRPNHIGISAVRLLGIDSNAGHVILELGGGDFLDTTPVIDIKPYIPYSDAVFAAGSGYSGRLSGEIEIHFTEEADLFCREYEIKSRRDLRGLIYQVLQQDPRPAGQQGKKKIFGVRLWDVNIRWIARGNTFSVCECKSVL